MKLVQARSGAWGRDAGKGAVGCVIFLVLAGIATFAGIKIVPDYYAHKSFEGEVQTQVARAGANFIDDETMIKDLLALAKKNEVKISRNHIKVERFAGQIIVSIEYNRPVDFIVFQKDMEFKIKASSYVGRL